MEKSESGISVAFSSSSELDQSEILLLRVTFVSPNRKFRSVRFRNCLNNHFSGQESLLSVKNVFRMIFRTIEFFARGGGRE